MDCEKHGSEEAVKEAVDDMLVVLGQRHSEALDELRTVKREVLGAVKGLMALLESTREEAVEERKDLEKVLRKPLDAKVEGTLNTVIQKLDAHSTDQLKGDLQDCVDLLRHWRPPRRVPWWVWPASVGFAVVLGIVGGWTTGSPLRGCRADVQRAATIGSGVDRMLRDQWTTLPTGLKQALEQVYSKAEVPTPDKRKGQ